MPPLASSKHFTIWSLKGGLQKNSAHSIHNTDILILIDIVGFPISELTKKNMTMAERSY